MGEGFRGVVIELWHEVLGRRTRDAHDLLLAAGTEPDRQLHGVEPAGEVRNVSGPDAVNADSRAVKISGLHSMAATAHKIARIVYHLLKYGDAYEAQSAAEYEEQRRERELRQLQRRASKLGMTLTPVDRASAEDPTGIPAT